MPDRNLIELAIKAVTTEAENLRSKAGADAASEREQLTQNINRLLGEVAAAAMSETDAGERAQWNALLGRLLTSQASLATPVAPAAPAPAPPPVSAAAAAMSEDGYAPYKLPSGVEVLTRRMPDGQISEYYYCPNCFAKGRTATLEFKFGGGGRHVCPRCQTSYSNIAAPAAAPALPPLSSPPPPQPGQDAAVDAAAAAQTADDFNAPPASPPPPPPPPVPQLKGNVLAAARDARGLPPPVHSAGGNAPAAWHVNRTAGVELAEIVEYTPGQLRFRRWWANFGQGGFMVSVFFHILLAIIITTVVIAVHVPAPAPDPTWELPGNEGKKGDNGRAQRIKIQTMKSVTQNKPPRIALPKASAVMLPDIPQLNNALIKSPADKLAGSGGGQKGLGPGMFGVGPGYNAPMVFKMPIDAQSLAVYLDDSGSMQPYLKTVKDEILRSFPYADIYEHDGIRIIVDDGKVKDGHRTGVGAFATQVLKSKEETLERYRSNFDSGSVGAWVDIMLHQGYDALIVFSDFQDGVEQNDTLRGRIFTDQPGQDKVDKRNAADKKWEEEWKNLCRTVTNTRDRRSNRMGRREGVKFYLFTIEVTPQKIWLDCVKESGGAWKHMPNLRVESGR